MRKDHSIAGTILQTTMDADNTQFEPVHTKRYVLAGKFEKNGDQRLMRFVVSD